MKNNNPSCYYSLPLATLLLSFATFSSIVESIALHHLLATSPNFGPSKIVNQTRERLTSTTQRTKDWRPRCPEAKIQVIQGLESSTGIPTYTVTITNVCYSNCAVAKVHLQCGWFASARVVDPDVFKRIAYNDCLVNGGRPIHNGHVIEFQYANSLPYSLSVASYLCWP